MILPSREPRYFESEVSRYSESEIPTQHGPAHIVVYREGGHGRRLPDVHEHVALVFGNARDNARETLVRVHSECLTSEVFGSLKCDCREQLDASFGAIREAGGGVVLYLRQEGRGIGLGNKIRAYALQAKGVDTVDANRHLGFADDLRDYGIAAAMLRDLGIERVQLLTNNPLKVQGLEEHGIEVAERIPIRIGATLHTAGYLEAKRARMGHWLDDVATDGD